MLIRNERFEDYRVVEEMIKKAFWNLSEPGCNEHYFAHQVKILFQNLILLWKRMDKLLGIFYM